VVRAIARTDAAVVNHQVQTFLVMHGRIDRTNVFARRGFAVLTKHWLRDDLRIINPFLELLLIVRLESLVIEGNSVPLPLRDVASVITVDTQPVHFTAAANQILAHNRDVILTLARHDARRATDARRQINRHTPLMMPGWPAHLLVG